jgi:competence protein ComEC
LILAFIGGIAASTIFADLSDTGLLWVSAAFLILSFMFRFLKIDNVFKLFIAISVFAAGGFYLKARTSETVHDNHIVNFADGEKRTIEGVITESVTHTGKGGIEVVLSGINVLSDGETQKTGGKLLVRAKNITHKLGYGDLLQFKGYIRKPTNFKNPGAFDYVRYLKSRGIAATSGIYKNKNIIYVKKGYKKGAFYYIQKLKETVNDFIYSNGFSVNKHVVSALLFGGKKQINKYVHELFIDTGTAHILAISGLHMGVVALFFYYLSIFFFKRNTKFTLKYNIIKLSYMVTLVFLILYSFLVGMRVSSIRAVIMIGVYILSILFDRAQNTLRTMFVAAFLILLIYPASLSDVSFMLSFSAVFAILYFYPKLNLRFDRFFEKKSDSYFRKRTSLLSIAKYPLLAFTLSFVINLIILPIILYSFNHISLSAPLINAIIIPIYSIFIIPLNFVIFFFSLLLPVAGTAVLHINEYMIHLSIVLLKFLDRYLNYSFYTVTPTPAEIALYYGFIFSIFKIKEKRFKAFASVFILLLVFSGFYHKLKPIKNDALEINFIDVSQSESFLIKFPNGENMLIDGGGLFKSSRFNIGRDVVAKFLWKNKIKKVNYIVSTHPHPDHIRGLFFIAANFNPDRIFIGRYEYDSKFYKNFVRRFNDKIEYVDENNKSLLIGDAAIEFINYDYNGPLKNHTGINRSSLVVMLKYNDKKVLFTADIDNDTEDYLLSKDIDLKSDILKIAHHGSQSSTSERFLKAVSPEYAIISVGYNNYFRLPSASTINLLKDNDIKIYRTDRDGMITAVLANNKINMTTYMKHLSK